MPTTKTDPRPELWERRRHITRILAKQRLSRALICGCPNCHDQVAGIQLDTLIARNQRYLAELNDQITDTQ